MKRIICVLLAVMMIVSLTACGYEKPESLDASEVKFVSVSESLFSSYLYLIEDEEAVAELTKLYNSVRYKPLADGEELPSLLLGKLYMLSFYDKEPVDGVMPEAVAWIAISPDGYVMPYNSENSFDDAYKLTSVFDEERLKQILKEYDVGGGEEMIADK